LAEAAAFAIATPSIGMADAELAEAALATNAAATTTNIDLRIARSFVFSVVQCVAAHVGSSHFAGSTSHSSQRARSAGYFVGSSSHFAETASQCAGSSARNGRNRTVAADAASSVTWAWLASAEISDGPVFRSIGKGGRISAAALTDRSVANIVKRSAAMLGLNPRVLSSHSLRAGFVTSALRALG
jgi:hypothetical protein